MLRFLFRSHNFNNFTVDLHAFQLRLGLNHQYSSKNNIKIAKVT